MSRLGLEKGKSGGLWMLVEEEEAVVVDVVETAG